MQRLFRLALLAALMVLSLSVLAQAAAPAPAAVTPAPGKILVKLETSMGDIVLELFKDKAPLSVASFLTHAKSGFYDNTIFHRVINSFMIQGGGFDMTMREKPAGPAIRNEADNGLKNSLYTVAMARTSDPHSASAQFYINVKDNRSLDYYSKTDAGWGYAVFGKVVDGKRVVDEIKGVPTGKRGMFDDVPLKPILIKKVTVLSE